jgi:hypothetical protein
MKHVNLRTAPATITSGLSRSLKNDYNALAIAMGAHGNSTPRLNAIGSSISTSSAILSTHQIPRQMNSRDKQQIQVVMTAFRAKPCPDTAEKLLLVLSRHRRENSAFQRTIDAVLEYRFLVGSIPATEEVMPLDSAVLDVQPLGVT